MGNENLPAWSGGSALLAIVKTGRFGINIATQTGGTQVIGLLDLHFFALGEIRRFFRWFGLNFAQRATSDKPGEHTCRDRLQM